MLNFMRYRGNISQKFRSKVKSQVKNNLLFWEIRKTTWAHKSSPFVKEN